MNTVINITDKLLIKQQEIKIAKLRFEVDTHISNAYNLRIENMSLQSQNDRLKDEIVELKKILSEVKVSIVYE